MAESKERMVSESRLVEKEKQIQKLMETLKNKTLEVDSMKRLWDQGQRPKSSRSIVDSGKNLQELTAEVEFYKLKHQNMEKEWMNMERQLQESKDL